MPLPCLPLVFQRVTIAVLANNGTRLMKNPNFWLGNVLLATALAVLLFMDTLSQMLGIGAVVLWMGLAAAGMYFIMKDGK